MEQTWKPAKTRWVVGLLTLALVAVAVFTVILSVDLQAVRTVDPNDYTETAVDNLQYTASASLDGRKIAITGWACVPEEHIYYIQNDIVLYLPSTGEYLMLPTEMLDNADATATLGDALDYASAGFYATCFAWQLEADLSEYELCMSYRSNYHDALVHTGLYLEVGA